MLLNPPVAVNGGAGIYECPDLATVDQHLADLAQRIRLAHALPNLPKQYWVDVDALLDRRAWLQLMAEETA